MSNLWLNLRFGTWHLQCGDPHWWSVRIRQNPYHVEHPPATFFEVH